MIIKKQAVEEAKSLIIEARQLMKERKSFLAAQKLMKLNDILLSVKDSENLLTKEEAEHLRAMERDARAQHGECKRCDDVLKKLDGLTEEGEG